MARGKPVRDPPGLWLAMCKRMRDESDGDDGAEMAEFRRRSRVSVASAASAAYIAVNSSGVRSAMAYLY